MLEREIELREKSGNVSTTDPLSVFLYLLAKDYLTINQLETLLVQVQETMPGTVVFNNGWLGNYVVEIKNKIEAMRDEQSLNKISKKNEEQMDLDDAELILREIQNGLSEEEFEKIKKDVQEYEVEEMLKNIAAED